MSAQSALQDRVDAAEESHRLRLVLARSSLVTEEARALAEYHCSFESTGWDRTAFRVYQAVMAFADGFYALEAAQSIRAKYSEIITAWVECRRSSPMPWFSPGQLPPLSRGKQIT
jgi:hypothetical protein